MSISSVTWGMKAVRTVTEKALDLAAPARPVGAPEWISAMLSVAQMTCR